MKINFYIDSIFRCTFDKNYLWNYLYLDKEGELNAGKNNHVDCR